MKQLKIIEVEPTDLVMLTVRHVQVGLIMMQSFQEDDEQYEVLTTFRFEGPEVEIMDRRLQVAADELIAQGQVQVMVPQRKRQEVCGVQLSLDLPPGGRVGVEIQFE